MTNKIKEVIKKAIKPLVKSEAGVKKSTKTPVVKKVATKKVVAKSVKRSK